MKQSTQERDGGSLIRIKAERQAPQEEGGEKKEHKSCVVKFLLCVT